jgi:hypothetical protein
VADLSRDFLVFIFFLSFLLLVGSVNRYRSYMITPIFSGLDYVWNSVLYHRLCRKNLGTDLVTY